MRGETLQTSTEKLSSFFLGVGAKRLTSVEVDPDSSNQHEFNGVNSLREIFGETDEKLTLSARFVHLMDDRSDSVCIGEVTWYDSRRSNPNRSAEYRLYWRKNEVMERAKPGDLMFFAKLRNGEFLILISESDSSLTNQLAWLFDLQLDVSNSIVMTSKSHRERSLDFCSRLILEAIGIDSYQSNDLEDLTELCLRTFNFDFPSTAEFSNFARISVSGVEPVEDPDTALMAWVSREHALFSAFEKRVIGPRIEQGFMTDGMPDVDSFIKFSLSVQNRRKARAGASLEHHVSAIFKANGLSFEREKVTEAKKKPDFLFPNQFCYHDPSFDKHNLRMLGVKSSLKDRWRQVLSEANRIERKHLLTPEPSISEAQLTEMLESQLQLVVPKEIHQTFKHTRRVELMNLEEFITEVTSLQS